MSSKNISQSELRPSVTQLNLPPKNPAYQSKEA